MTTNILKAISKMLEKKEGMDGKLFEVSVGCAKTMLDEIISGLSNGPDIILPDLKFKAPVTKEPRELIPKPKTPSPDKPYKVVVDGGGKITRIENLPSDAILYLDGKKMTHKEAIGKTFTKVTLP